MISGIGNLHVEIDGEPILQSLSLIVDTDEMGVVMDPNRVGMSILTRGAGAARRPAASAEKEG